MPLKVTIQPGELETFLKVDQTDDAGTIEVLKEAAISEAETFLNTDFSTTNEETGETIANEAPAPVKAWVFNRVAQLYENRGDVGQQYMVSVTAIGPEYSILKPYRIYSFKG